MTLDSEYLHRVINYDDVKEATSHEKKMMSDGWEIVGRWTELTTEFRKVNQYECT